METLGMGWSTPMAKLLKAGVAATGSNDSRAAVLLEEAVQGFEAADMALYAAAARRCLGTVLKGDEGAALTRDADAWMTGHTVKDPARLTAMLAPGFAR
jgi:hypothetical protein